MPVRCCLSWPPPVLPNLTWAQITPVGKPATRRRSRGDWKEDPFGDLVPGDHDVAGLEGRVVWRRTTS